MSTAADGVATYIRHVPNFANGALYQMKPVHEGHEYVVVSAVHNGWAHETYIFPATADGEITDWLELGGSLKDTTDHAEALRNAGYVIAQATGAPA